METAIPTVDELQRRFETIIPASRIGQRLRALVSEGTVNPDEILPLIRLEPLLATRILREANLMENRTSEGSLSIDEAVTAVGFQRMYDLIGLYSYPDRSDNVPSYSTEIWKRAITCALCMENLSAKHRLDPQQGYTIGLVHSLAEALVDSLDERGIEDGGRSDRLRLYSYSGLCYSFLADWGLPAGIVDPIRFQYSPLDCQTTGKMACILNLSKWITGVIREYDELPDQNLGPDLLVLNLLGEGEQTLWNLVTDVSDALLAADTAIQGPSIAC